MKHCNQTHYNITNPTHITYRLEGSLPQNELERLTKKKTNDLDLAFAETLEMPENVRRKELAKREFKIEARFELDIDDYLHHHTSGPWHLKSSTLASIVIDSIKYLHETKRVYAFAICVMSNHVHLVMGRIEGHKEVDIGQFMKDHKSFTGQMCNQSLGRINVPFWSSSYFDRTVRYGKFTTVMWYLLNNPVKAGLVERWNDWEHTWVNPDYVGLFLDS